MISAEQYFGPWADSPDATPERRANAERLLAASAALEALMVADGVVFPVNPATHTQVGGRLYGGFCPQSCPQGAPLSANKEGMAWDRFDPLNAIDDWLMAHQEALVECGIYIEAPDETDRWSHWSIRPPASGKHVFHK